MQSILVPAGNSTREVVSNAVYNLQSLQLKSWRLPPSVRRPHATPAYGRTSSSAHHITLKDIAIALMIPVDSCCSLVQNLALTALKQLIAALYASYGHRPGCVPTLSAMAAVVQCTADNNGYGPCISLGRGLCRCNNLATVEMLLRSTENSSEIKLRCVCLDQHTATLPYPLSCL